jgi:hypothetical protein
VYRGPQLIASTAGTTFTDSGLAASTAYNYSVSACDIFGDCSPQSVPVSATAEATGGLVLPQPGYWYDKDQVGSGFAIDVDAASNSVFFMAYLYEEDGTPTWLSAGPAPMTGSTFTAPLTAFSGGQSLNDQWSLPAQGTSPGTVSISFSDGADGTLTWPGGMLPITRYNFQPESNAPIANVSLPQTGVWWNSSQPGTGYYIEVQNGVALVTAFLYDSTGSPTWYTSSTGALSIDNIYQGILFSYSGGQTLTGSYRVPNGTSTAGNVTLLFSSPTNGMLILPDNSQIQIQRFAF